MTDYAKVSGLTEATIVADTDLIEISQDQGGGVFLSKRVTGANSINSKLSSTGATTGATSQAQAFTNGVITPKIYPSADSTTAVGIFKADGTTNVLNVDTTNGRVGIGTTAPTGSLHIVNSEQTGYPTVLLMHASYSGADPGFEFKRASGGTSGDYFARIRGSAGSTWLSLYSNSGVNRIDQQLNIHSNGKVGIGTTAPGEKLDVVGNINFPTTTSTSGIIKQNGSAFIHTYAPTGSTGSNLFIGGAGNFTATYTSGLDSSLNIGIGNGALTKLTTGFRNTVIGRYAGQELTTGSYNNLFGSYSGNVLVDGVSNNFQGWYAGGAATNGSRNTAVGESATRYNITGSDNTAFGFRALFGVSTNSHSNNTAIGASSGYGITTGNRNVFLGYQAGYNQTTNSDRLIIDNQNRTSAAIEATNALIYGVFNATPANQILTFNANVGIGTTAPGSKLTVSGHIGSLGTIPTLTSAGTGASIRTGSTDTAGEITQGTTATGAVITFAIAYTNIPFAVVTSQAGLAFSYTVSTTAITITNIGALSETKLSYHVVASE